MRLLSFLRFATLFLMALSLVVGFLRPDFFLVLRRWLVWLVPMWIAVLFLVQTLVTPGSNGITPLAAWTDRLRRRKWSCPKCGQRHPMDVPLCYGCGALRPDVAALGRPWVCEVCEAENEAEAVACERCTVPRPDKAA